MAFHLQRRLTKPVIELLSGIERSRKEGVMHDFKMEADVEFQQLGHAFNQAYRELKSAQDGILQAEKMAAVGKLAAGVAHEVGNPLASISSVVQLMRRRCQSEDQLQQIDLIMDHIRRISGFVRELLNFTRPPKDDKRDMVDIVAMLDQAVSLLGYDERSKEVRVISEYDEDLMKVSANADRLAMVFTNIIVNAFDAMAGHEGSQSILRISAQNENEKVVVRFSDNGPGMSEEAKESAFEPFFSTKQPGSGTGLGLWICYETVQRHDGTIRIETPPDGGCTVVVELPGFHGAPAEA
ncbi:MAG: sensor histidine kinase [Planctomycetota bacterium]